MLDIVRLAEDRWLARAVTTRRDGVTVVLEEVLVSRDMPKVEAATILRDDRAWLVLRDRDDPDAVIAETSLEVPHVRLRLVRAPSQSTPATPPPSPTPTGPPVPA